ncbi:MAG: hypothetical protein D6692_01485 [Planctomycetota bacterium]|nr:MAG: hypothetical protein D6692_01485 [Planctomycetota bacterium]
MAINKARALLYAGGAVAAVAVFAVVYTGRSEHRHATAPGTAATDVSAGEIELVRTGYAYQFDGGKLEDLSEETRSFALRDQEWAERVEFVPVRTGPSALAAAWAPTLLDPSGVADEVQHASLLTTIADHAWARAQDTPSAYVSLVDRSPDLAWNEPDATNPTAIEIRRRNAQTGVFYTYFLEQEFDPGLSSLDLARVVWDGLRRFDHLIDEVGVGESGCRILITRARAPAELDRYGLVGKNAPENPDYWWSDGGRYGMEFVRPVRSAASWLADLPSLVVAQANIIVKLRDGRLGNWQSRWYLHPETGDWVLDAMQATSGKTMMLVW